jgi:hypothetical protein
MNYHEGKKLYVCTITGCGKSFFERGNLKYHEKKVHKSELEEMPYTCKHIKCNLKFKTKSEKLKHHHQMEPTCELEKFNLINLIESYRENITYLVSKLPNEEISKIQDELKNISQHNDTVIQEFFN